MFELPECVVLANQMNETIKGKTIQSGSLGNSPHKFVWYNRTHAKFAELIKGKTIGEAQAKGRWLFVPLDPGYILVIGECGLHNQPGGNVSLIDMNAVSRPCPGCGGEVEKIQYLGGSCYVCSHCQN